VGTVGRFVICKGSPLSLSPSLLSVFRKGAASVIATIAQNNRKVQTEAVAQGALQYVSHMAVHDPDPTVRVKAYWALSCLIRNFPPGEGAFVSADGVLVVCRGVGEEDERCVRVAPLVPPLASDCPPSTAPF